MRILGWLVVLALLLIGAFAAVNWAAFTTPTTRSLVALDVYAPLGVVMLSALLALTLLALGFAATWRTSMLDASLRGAISAAVNSVSAAVGELEDKVDRALAVGSPARPRA